MLSLPTPRKRGLSKAANAEISTRVDLSRGLVLDELARLCAARAGMLTPPQVAAVAALLSHVQGVPVPSPGHVQGVLAAWLTEVGADPALDEMWAASDEGVALAERLARADESRRDLSLAALLGVFGVTDAEAEALGLTHVVPERTRSRVRRRAEGVEPRRSRPPQAAPWVAAGVSRATWFRRQVAERAAVEAAVEEQSGTVRGIETPNDLNTREGCPENPDSSYYSIRSPGVSPPWQPSVADLPTAEGRRYGHQALTAGARWRCDGADWRESPYAWFDWPENLPPSVRSRLTLARQAADRALARRRAVVWARERRDRTPPPPPLDPQACPARVSPAVWEQVPPDLRPAVLMHAGRLFLAGHDPDHAVVVAVDAARRERSRAKGIAAVVPGADPKAVADMARRLWREPLSEAVAAGAAAVQARTATAAGSTPADLARARDLAARLADPPYPASYAEEAVAVLAEALSRPENRGVAPRLLVEQARQAGYARSRADTALS